MSSPPHATQVVGVRLARRLGSPLVADLRDPWLFGELDALQGALVDRWFGAWAQRRMLRQARLVVCNTQWAAAALERKEPRLAGRIETVPNGYDARESRQLPDRKLFRVAFVGWLYSFMDPDPILAACARLRARERLTLLRLAFIGSEAASGRGSLRDRARAHSLERDFYQCPPVSRAEAIREQELAAVNVVFDYPGPLPVPMKFYDSLQARGDMLLIGRPKSALANAAARLGLSVCAPDDDAAIDSVLQKALDRWRPGAYDTPKDPEGVFARIQTAGRMQELLEALRTATTSARAGL